MSPLVHSSFKSSMSLLPVLMFLLASPMTAQALIFTTDFEAVPDQTNPASTTTVNNGGLSADFTGGTIDTVGILALYNSGIKSWMVEPAGDMTFPATGVSTGTGMITLTTPADSIQVCGKNQSTTTVAEVRVFDTAAMMISGPTTLNSTSWTDISVTRMMGETRIGSIQLIVTSTMGTGMAALDDLSYSTAGDALGASPCPAAGPAPAPVPVPAPGGGGGSSAINMWFAMALLGLVMLSRRKQNGC